MGNANLTVDVKEIPLLMRASTLYLSLSLMFFSVSFKNVEATMAELQRMRAFLERFTEFAHAMRTKSPIEILDHVAKKNPHTAAQLVDTGHACAVSSHLLLTCLGFALKSVPLTQGAPVVIDRKKMN